MKQYLVLLLFMLLPAHADIYRSVDSDGNVVFTDEHSPHAEKVELPASTIYTPEITSDDALADVPVEQADEQVLAEPVVIPDYKIRIISPGNDESVWVNDGNVMVNLLIEPALDAERGDKVIVRLDAETSIGPIASSSVQLTNIDRGTHSLVAIIVDQSGGTLTRSTPINFHLHRAFIKNKPAN